MAVSWRIGSGYIFLASDEAATLQEWKAALNAAIVAPGFVAGMGVVHDLRDARRVSTPDEARERVAFVVGTARQAGIKRWAVVIATAGHHDQVAEFLSEPAHGIAFRVFHDSSRAEAWARGWTAA